MIYYVNIGFILEQALVDIVKLYLDRLNVDGIYKNYHISVVNEHPFAHMIIDDHAKCADNFPAVVITTQSDSKSSDLLNVPVQTSAIGFNLNDFEDLLSQNKRIKEKINQDGELETVIKKETVQTEKIPGLMIVYDSERIEKIKNHLKENNYIYGLKLLSRRKDRVSVEIWAENNQLKNEIYEHLRILFSNSLNLLLDERYSSIDPNIFDGTVNGERSSNYNFDFDTVLNGSHISFDVEYNVLQYIFDTNIKEFNPENIVMEVKNHVKRQ